jgi:hypothetical protein
MADFGFNPELKAQADINPFRMVMLQAGTPFTGAQATAGSKLIVGVTDGSVKRFDSTVNAAAGDPINLQPSMTVQVEAGAAFAAGVLLKSDGSGRAIASATAGDPSPFIALEAAAAAGEIVRAFRVGYATF